MHLRIFTLITVTVLLAGCASEPQAVSAPWTIKQIIIQFDQQTGEQNGLRLITPQGQTDFVQSNGTPAGGEPPQNVLWGNTSQLELIEGSNCVKIAGKKYCG